MPSVFPGTTRAVVLLAAFLAGGVAAPVLHRVHHAAVWASLRGEAACDHATHGERLEAALPGIEAEPCPQCLRHLPALAASDAASLAAPDAADVSWAPLLRGPSDARVLHAIRGPPAQA